MPNPVGGGVASSMPTADGSTPNGGGSGGASNDPGYTPGQGQWMPVWQIGSGLTGVFTDARQMIAGGTATATSAAITPGVANTSASDSEPDAGYPQTAGPSGGAASSMPSGAANANGQPTPKASSLAQQQANNAEAQREFPGYQGATG